MNDASKCFRTKLARPNPTHFDAANETTSQKKSTNAASPGKDKYKEKRFY
jgi:hypothetical protein